MSLHIQGPCCATHLRSIPKNVLNLELSSGGFSAPAPGVEARDAAFEGVVEVVVEPGRVFSAASSAMASVMRVCSGILWCLHSLRQAGIKGQAVMSSCVAVRVPCRLQVTLPLAYA